MFTAAKSWFVQFLVPQHKIFRGFKSCRDLSKSSVSKSASIELQKPCSGDGSQ